MRAAEALRLRVARAERAAGALAPATLAEAERLFSEHGCVVLDGLFDVELVDRLHQTYESQLGSLTHAELHEKCGGRGGRHGRYLEVGHMRYEIVPRMAAAFGDPAAFANPALVALLRRWLGDECQLNSFTVVVSYPGAELQHIHRDSAYLFAGHPDEISTSLPPYAVNVGIPLIDVDLATGPTAVFPGSHRWPLSRAPDPAAILPVALARGDCMITDYRTLHAGMPNRGARARPNLYLSYTRPWFFDETNHTTRTPTDVPVGAYAALPELRVLLRRANARRAQSPEPAPAPSRGAPDPSRAKRECPCGSGALLEDCHGRASPVRAR